MVATDVLFLTILEFIIFAIAATFVFRGVRIYMRRRKPSVQTPKLRTRNVLYDNRFGSAIGIGYTPMSIDKRNIHLQGVDNHIFSIPYRIDELYPEDPVHAFAGATSSRWRVKGQTYIDIKADEEKTRIEKENIELKEQNLKQQIKTKIAVNEAAVLPDRMDELIRDIQKVGKSENIRIVK